MQTVRQNVCVNHAIQPGRRQFDVISTVVLPRRFARHFPGGVAKSHREATFYRSHILYLISIITYLNI